MATRISFCALSAGASQSTISRSPLEPVTLEADYDMLRLLDLPGGPVLAGCRRGAAKLDLYPLAGGALASSPISTVDVEQEIDDVRGLVFANTGYVMTYRARDGRFDLLSLDSGLKRTARYAYSRTHAPAPTAAFTMVRPFLHGSSVAIMGYGFESGAVSMYGVTGLATSASGIPPVSLHVRWDHVWAPGWVRFAFFQLGGATYFLKTNIKYPNVNIDRVNDDPATGTAEVTTRMTLPDAKLLEHVESFTVGHGDPYFVAGRADGLVTAYRIYSDCSDWTPVASIALEPALAVLPLSGPDSALILHAMKA